MNPTQCQPKAKKVPSVSTWLKVTNTWSTLRTLIPYNLKLLWSKIGNGKYGFYYYHP
jgi:hypothetical protein